MSCLAMIAIHWHLPLGAHSQVPAFSSFKQERLSRLLTEQKGFLFPWELECCFPG